MSYTNRSTASKSRHAKSRITHHTSLLSYLLLTALMTWPLVTQLTTAIPGDGFDGWQNYWNQWWIKVALVDRLQTPFWTDLLYAPTGVGLYFHTLNPFNGLITLPIQLSTGLIPAYNAVIFLSWPLAGYGVYLLVLWLLQAMPHQSHKQGMHSPPQAARNSQQTIQIAPFVAGVIFTFSPFHMAHLLGHMQVMSLQWIPFYILYLLRATTEGRSGQPWLRSALLAGLFLTLTGLCDWYFVLYLFFFTGLLLFWQWGLLVKENGALPMPKVLRLLTIGLAASVAGLVMLLLLSPMLIPMVREATQFSFMVRPTSDLYILSASLLDFLIPSRLHLLSRMAEMAWPGNQIAPVSERTIAIGYVPLGLAIGALFMKARPRAWRNFWVISALFFLTLALGPTWHFGNITALDIPALEISTSDISKLGTEPMVWTPFALLNEFIPFMRISRSVSRYALMVQLSMAVLAGFGLQTVLERLNGRWLVDRFRGALISGLLLFLILFEFWVAPFPMSLPDTPAFYSTLQTMGAVGTVLNLPMNYDRPGYLLYQTVHQHPLAVAYISRDDPRTLTERVPVLQHFRHLGPDIIDVDPVVVGPTVLNDLGIGVVIQDRYKMPGGLERTYTEDLANTIFAHESPLFTDDRLTVHMVQPPDRPQPYLQLGALNWGPLEIDAAGKRRRLLGGAGALLHFAHVQSAMQLQLHYRTLPTSTLNLLDEAGTLLMHLPPAPTGAVVTATLADLSATAAPSTAAALTQILLQPGAVDSVWIERVALLN